MNDFYVIFFCLKLPPKYFYLFVNMVDLVYKTYYIDFEILDNITRSLYIFERFLVEIIIILNFIMFLLGLTIYLFYLFTHSFRTTPHKFYVLIRFIITSARVIIFLSIAYFYSKTYFTSQSDLEITIWELFYSYIMVYLEIRDFFWCFPLKEIIFHQKNNFSEKTKKSSLGENFDSDKESSESEH